MTLCLPSADFRRVKKWKFDQLSIRNQSQSLHLLICGFDPIPLFAGFDRLEGLVNYRHPSSQYVCKCFKRLKAIMALACKKELIYL